MNTLVTVTKAALILGSTPSRVMQLCHTGQLRSGELGGAMVIPTSSVQEYAQKLRIETDRATAR